MKTRHIMILGIIASAWLSLGVASARAGFITNGGFESGLAGWTSVDLAGSDGTFFSQVGTLSPVNGDPVPAPPEGLMAAMTDAGAPGSHVLYQDFVVPTSLSTDQVLFFASLFIGNRADRFAIATPPTLDFGLPGLARLNQRARVDFTKSGVDPFTLAPSDVLLTVFETKVGDALVSGYNRVSADVTSLFAGHPGETLRLRFAEVDNLAPLQFGVDDVQLNRVPEPASVAIVAVFTMLAGASTCRLSRGRSRGHAT